MKKTMPLHWLLYALLAGVGLGEIALILNGR